MDYDYDGGAGIGGLIAIWLVLLPLLLIFALAGYLLTSWFLMRIFDKAGVQGKWRAWVPVYNLMVFAKLGDLSPWVMLGAIVVSSLLGQIPVLGWIFSLVSIAALVMAGWRVGLKLGKDWPWLLLWLIPGVGFLIWLGILAFDKSTWNPNVAPLPWANASFLRDTTVWNGVPQQPAGIGAGPGQSTPGAYPPPGYPQGYQAPQGYQPPPQGYQAPPEAFQAPPQGYQPPPQGGSQPPQAPPPAAPDTPPADPGAPRP